MTYDSTVPIASVTCPGVTYAIKRISFGSRLTLMGQLRDLLKRLEFHAAGEGTVENLEASIVSGEVDRILFSWGAAWVSGLIIDGQEPTLQAVFDLGPEPLIREIVHAIKRESSLSEDELKN
jgi:hypothetical protein